jgi:hypothetical protein
MNIYGISMEDLQLVNGKKWHFAMENGHGNDR